MLMLFSGGMYGLAAHEEKDSNSERWMKIAEGRLKRVDLFFTMFLEFKGGLKPEEPMAGG